MTTDSDCPSALDRFTRNLQFATLRSRISTAPRGTVLLLVLVVVMLLSLGAYIFAETMVSERAATEMYARKVVTRTAADSGIEYVAAILDRRSDRFMLDINHNPELFQGIVMRQSERIAGRARFSIVAPVDSDPANSSIRFGLVDESGKLNLNTLLPKQKKKRRNDEEDDSDPIIKSESDRAEEDLPRLRLLRIPGMTHELADAILDWIDEDDVPRQYGAENEYYANFNRQPRNGPLQSLDELLSVRAVSRELLYGEDANLNGLLDANENDGAQTSPLDNEDGVLDRGWSAFLTVYSRETNLRADGDARINVNAGALDELKQKLTAAFDEEIAEFVVAFRSYGPSTGKPGADGQNSMLGENQAASLEGTASDNAREIRSLYELIGAEVTVPGKQTLQSPWSSEASSIQRELPEILEKLTISGEPFMDGRININQARREVLLGVPGLNQQLVDAIINSQSMLSRSSPTTTNGYHVRSTTAWLLVEGLVDLATMRKLDRFLTARGDVFRLQVVSYYELSGPTTRLEAVVDATRRPSKLISIRDLSNWGAGYSRDQLNFASPSR